MGRPEKWMEGGGEIGRKKDQGVEEEEGEEIEC